MKAGDRVLVVRDHGGGESLVGCTGTIEDMLHGSGDPAWVIVDIDNRLNQRSGSGNFGMRVDGLKLLNGPPIEIQCVWLARKGERGTYDCLNCKGWTANLPLYRTSICPAKDRRQGAVDRRKGNHA